MTSTGFSKTRSICSRTMLICCSKSTILTFFVVLELSDIACGHGRKKGRLDMNPSQAKVRFLPPIPKGILDRSGWQSWIKVHQACAKNDVIRSALFDDIDRRLSGDARALTLVTLIAAKWHPANVERGKPMWGGNLSYEVEKGLSMFAEHCDKRWVNMKELWRSRKD